MTAPVVILPPSAAIGIEARSKVERQALFHVAGTGLWARNGATVRFAPVLGSLILALAAARGRTLAYGAAIDAVWGDDPEGGSLDPLNLFAVHRSRAKDDLAALGISIETWWGCGYTLKLKFIKGPNRRSLPIVQRAAPDPYWAPQARAMRERGATWNEVGAAVDRSPRVVRRVLRGHQHSTGKVKTGSIEARRRSNLRKAAREESALTGEFVEVIYARWGCETVDRSRLWDQRRAAAQRSEARP